MKTNSLILFLMFLTAAVVFTPASYAQGTCTNAAAAGTYSVTCSGFSRQPVPEDRSCQSCRWGWRPAMPMVTGQALPRSTLAA